MKRWGMLDDGEMPEPNVNIRLAMDWLDTYADDMSLSILGTVIPMLEVALDGALLKFLLEEVDDPSVTGCSRRSTTTNPGTSQLISRC